MHMNFLHDAKAVMIEGAATAGTSLLTSDVVDMQGFESVCFIAMLGDVTDTSELSLSAFSNDTADTVSSTELEQSVDFVAGAADADNKLMILDLHKPRERYVYATLARATANAVVTGIIAVLYNPHQKPVTQDASVLTGSAHVNDPAPA